MRLSAPAAWFALILTLALAAPVFAQAEDPAHGELRAMRAALLDAITKQDIDKVLPLLHPNVVVTWQNGEVNRGHAGVKAFFEKMGRQAFGGYKVPPEPDELTILHGGTTGISFGRSVAQFNVLGKSFEFHRYAGAHHAFYNDTRPAVYHPEYAKRAHDRAKSTAYGVGLFGASALTTALGGTLQTINADSARDLILTSIAGILPLWYFIEFGFFSGWQGSNAYGDDPRNDPWQN